CAKRVSFGTASPDTRAAKWPDASVRTTASTTLQMILTVTPATGLPPSINVPDTFAARRPLIGLAEKVIAAGTRRSDCASTVPATSGCPLAGVYGVARRRQRYSPEPAPKTPLTLSAASSSPAPRAARPGVPAGRSGGGRQTVILAAANGASAASAAIGSTKIGTSSVCPAALRTMTQKAA